MHQLYIEAGSFTQCHHFTANDVTDACIVHICLSKSAFISTCKDFTALVGLNSSWLVSSS